MTSPNLFNQFLKTLPSFGDNPEAPMPLPPGTPAITSTFFKMVIEKAVSIDTIVALCLKNQIRILSAKDIS